jgi:gliding motility-associated protein GldM
MAGGNISPRQKMINMMYLVLTALLALNVSKEILDAFVVVNIGLNQQRANIEQKNESWYKEFVNQDETVNRGKNLKVKQARQNADEVSKIAKEMSAFVHSMKVDLVMLVDAAPTKEEAENRIKNPSSIDKKDDYDKPTHYFGAEPETVDKGKARELKLKLNDYKKKLMALVDEKNKLAMESRLSLLNTPDPDSKDKACVEDAKCVWEMKYFYHLPLSAALVELTKWENIIKGAEAEMLTYFWDQISATAFKFDAVEAKVIPKSSFVTSGSNFEAEVFLAAFSTSFKPTIVYGTAVDSATGNVTGAVQLDSTLIRNGKGYISLSASGQGERTFAGVIKMIDPVTQKETSYPYQTVYNVAPPSASVAPTNMNVFYRGLENPISVSVPGAAPNNIIVNVTGGSISGSNGTYNVVPGAGKEMSVNVSVKNPGGKTSSMGSFKFRVKPIPQPEFKWGTFATGSKIDKSTAAVSPLVAELPGFEFPVKASVLKYDISYVDKGNLIEITNQSGRSLSVDVQNKIKKLPKNTKVFFENVKVQVPGETKTIKIAVFTIN